MAARKQIGTKSAIDDDDDDGKGDHLHAFLLVAVLISERRDEESLSHLFSRFGSSSDVSTFKKTASHRTVDTTVKRISQYPDGMSVFYFI
jgi:hypothetical protein